MKFPRKTLDITQYLQQVKSLLSDDECAIFIDTNVISQLYRLNDAARQDFYNWIEQCGNRFHVPIWVIHEYSNKVYSQKTKEYLSELDRIKKQATEFNSISDFVKGYVGDSLLQGSMYEGKIDDLKKDVDNIKNLLNKIGRTINQNLEEHQRKVHDEIELKLSPKSLTSNIYSLIPDLDVAYRQRYENQIPPGYKDASKEDNRIGDLIIWKEILEYCKTNAVKKAILLSRDSKQDIVYSPETQTIEDGRKAGESERIKIAKESLVYEFISITGGTNFCIIDFKTFVRIFASEYRELAKSFQLATAEEEQEADNNSTIITTETTSCSTIEQGNNMTNSSEDDAEISAAGQDLPLYLGAALCDGQYDLENPQGCMDLYIEQLKSYNWYIQNPAINNIMKISKIDAENTDINRSSVFVLGRNILQSAEGSSGSAMSFIESFSKSINTWEPVFKKALIDGMLFEIYFNSSGEVRPKNFKATFFEEIMSNIIDLHLDNPFAFINEKLERVKTRFVPKVGTSTQYVFAFDIDSSGNTKSLRCNDVDISNTFKSSYLYEFSNPIQIKVSLMQYYGMDKKHIQVEGIPSNISSIKYIEEPMELPF